MATNWIPLTDKLPQTEKGELFVRSLGSKRYEVTNRTKGVTYEVELDTINGRRVGRHAAGRACIAGERDMHCKHLRAAAAVRVATLKMQAGR